MKKLLKFTFCASLVIVSLSVSSCRTYKKGTLTQNKIRVAEEKHVEEFVFDGNLDAKVNAIGKNYSRYGDGEIYASILYDPRSKDQTAMMASEKAADLSKVLRDFGAPSVRVELLPVKGNPNMSALITYNTYKALPPEDCRLLSGIEDPDHRTELDYSMGCSVSTMIARQISNPKDLTGRGLEDSHHDARGLTNQLDIYRAGTLNEPLGGETTGN